MGSSRSTRQLGCKYHRPWTHRDLCLRFTRNTEGNDEMTVHEAQCVGSIECISAQTKILLHTCYLHVFLDSGKTFERLNFKNHAVRNWIQISAIPFQSSDFKGHRRGRRTRLCFRIHELVAVAGTGICFDKVLQVWYVSGRGDMGLC